jgi:zinc-finger of transposase IS204/IS1001/IS1096/IS1165
LSSLVIEDVTDVEGGIVVRARTAGGLVACPRCCGLTGQVHGYCARTVADVPADGRPVVVRVRVRRMRCPVRGCLAQTFREQVPGVLDRYQRRTVRLAGQAGEVARRLAGRAGAGLLAALGVPLSGHTVLRLLLRLPLPEVSVPRVLGVDLSRSWDYPDCRVAALGTPWWRAWETVPAAGQVGIIPPVLVAVVVSLALPERVLRGRRQDEHGLVGRGPAGRVCGWLPG